MLTSLRIQNFKCWRDTGEMRLAPITGFFGANSSGKSSILQFLLMLKQTVESSDRNQVLNFGNDERAYVQLGTFREAVHYDGSGKPAGDIEWSLGWLPQPGSSAVEDSETVPPHFIIEKLKFSAVIGYDFVKLNRRLIVKRFEYEFGGRSLGMENIGGPDYKLIDHGLGLEKLPGRPDFLPQPVKSYGFPSQIGAHYKNTDSLSDVSYLFEEQINRLYYLGPLRQLPERQYLWSGVAPTDVGRRGERAIEVLLADRLNPHNQGQPTIEEKVARWLRELGLIHEFKLEPLAKESELYRVLMKKTPNDVFVSLPDVGFGVSQVLPVLVQCYCVPESSTLLFEQPEIHLHPAVQAGLADVFVEVAKKRNVQIILESHSEHLLARLQRRMAEEGVEEQGIASDKVALYFCKKETAEARLEELKLDQYGNITNWPKDFFGDKLSEHTAMIEATLERQKREEAA